MNALKNLVRKTPVVREIALFFLKTRILIRYVLPQWVEIMRWFFGSNETANFTYELTELNKQHLASLIAIITDRSVGEIVGYIQELEDDQDLRNHIQKAILASTEKHFADSTIHYGRRIGWYAIARAIKPKVIIETGVDKGMGSCVLTAALLRNDVEGCPGRYYGTDINPRAGYLLSGKYGRFGEILYGDSISSLTQLDVKIDLFINDSDHSADYEAREYAIIAEKLGPHAFVLGDNAHVTAALLDFALATSRRFVYFQERPLRHWYSGAGIGIAFSSERKPQ